MNRLRRAHLTSAVVGATVAILGTTAPAGAHTPGPTLSGYGTPVIDGVLSPGEWAAAGQHGFTALVPPNDGGGTTPATLLIMNDAENLYIALELERSGPPRGSFSVEFDNDHDGLLFEEGDDVFVANPGTDFFDDFRTQLPPCSPGVICGLLDTQASGTNDGRSVATGDGNVQVYEVERPLDSADDLHDFSLAPGDTVGFHAWIQVWSLVPSCNFGPSCVADTRIPPFGTGDIVANDGSDASPPETRIVSGPEDDSLTRERFPSFGFEGGDDTTSPEALRFECSLDGAPFEPCTSPISYADLGDGGHTFAVRALDEAGKKDPSPSTRGWTVDTTAPSLTLVAMPSVLWPPNHRLVPVSIEVSADDASGAPAVALISARSSEPDDGNGDGNTSGDIREAALETLDAEVLLRAERSRFGDGRTYTLKYEAVDRVGNRTVGKVRIRVPLTLAEDGK